MKGAHQTLTDQASTVRAEVVEVGPQINPLGEHDVPSKKGRWNWLRLAGLAALLLAGIGLMPGGQQSSPSATVDLTLPQPVIATSTIPVAPRAVAVVTDETFPLIPVADLDGFGHFAGPVEFAGRYWVAAGTATPSSTAVILSSSDGSRWVPESELTGTEASLMVQELVVFRSKLVVVASLSSLATTSMSPADHSQRLGTWASADGRTWSFQALPDIEGVGYYDVKAAAGNDRLIISAGTYEVYGELIEAVIPADFRPAMAADQLVVNWERRSNRLIVRLMAPPGLEVFSTEIAVSSPRLVSDSRVLLTEDLNSWDALDPSIAGTWGLAWSEDIGFVRRGIDGATLISADGQLWEPSADLPPIDFRTWREGLLGIIDTTGGTVDLLVVDNGAETRIGLPSDMFVANGYPWIEAGPGGLIAAVTRYEIKTYKSATVTSGGLLLTLDSAGRYEVLVVRKNGQDHARILLGTPSAKANYDPASGLIEIPPSEGIELTTIPLEDLAAFWTPPPNSARTEFYQSPDGLIWSKGEAAVFSDGVTLIGGTDHGFLIGVGANAIAGWEGDMTVLRTGPID